MLLSLFMLIVGSIADLLALAFLIRFAMHWSPALFRSPFGNFIAAVTDWALLPARKLVPGLFGLDMASFVLAWLVQALHIALILAVTGLHGGTAVPAFGVAALAGLVEAIRLGIYLAMALIVISALLSWLNPYAPLAPAIHRLADLLLRPVRRVIPPIGNVDLSPLFVLLALQAALIVLGFGRAALLPFVAR
jgi:YggT family protein